MFLKELVPGASSAICFGFRCSSEHLLRDPTADGRNEKRERRGTRSRQKARQRLERGREGKGEREREREPERLYVLY